MNKQELIERLLDCSRSLQQLAEHLQAAELTEAPLDSAEAADEPADKIAAEAADEAVIEVTAEAAADEPTDEAAANADTVKASAANPFARLFAGLGQNSGSIPANANPFNLLNMLAGGKSPLMGGIPGLSGLSGGMNLPGTLAELHDNPQIMSMLNQVAANPQSLNLISSLTGQSPEALQAALQSLQPNGAAAPAMPVEATPVAAAPAAAISAAVPAAAPSATAHLDNLLAEWHWQPYARVWER